MIIKENQCEKGVTLTEGSRRRKKIIEILSTENTPVSGTDLAAALHVSRQIIVQDIALLRAENRDILSTNKGYVLYKPAADDHFVKEVIAVKHDGDQILEEMLSIVELGGKMLDVSIDHDIYGNIRSDLVINSFDDAKEFVKKVAEGTSKPLCSLTENVHFHTISAPSAKVLGLIKKDLDEKGFLIRE